MKAIKSKRDTARRAGTVLAALGLFVATGSALPGCSGLHKTIQIFTGNGGRASGPVGEAEMAHFVSGVRSVRGNPESHYRLGTYHQERGRHLEALEEFQKSLLIDPGFLKAYKAMGVSYDFIGRHEHAVAAYRRVLEANPDDDAALNNLGYSLYLKGEYAEAIETFSKAIRLNPEARKYHSNLGRTLFEIGSYEEALAEFRRAFDEAGAQYYLAHFYYQKGLYEKAQYHYAKALAVNPMFRTAKKGLKAARQMARIHDAPAKDKEQEPTENVEVATAVEASAVMSPPKMRQLAPTAPPAVADEDRGGATQPRTEAAVSVPHPEITAAKSEESPTEGAPVKVSTPAPEQTAGPGHASSGMGDFVLARCHVKEQLGEKVTVLVFSRSEELKRTFEVELSNGSGEGALLSSLSSYLRKKGYERVCEGRDEVGNCNATQIYYQDGYLQPAYRVAKQIPGYQEMKKVSRIDGSSAKVRVVIGKDMLQHGKTLSDG